MCEPIIYKKHVKSGVTARVGRGTDIYVNVFKFVRPLCSNTRNPALYILSRWKDGWKDR